MSCHTQMTSLRCNIVQWSDNIHIFNLNIRTRFQIDPLRVFYSFITIFEILIQCIPSEATLPSVILINNKGEICANQPQQAKPYYKILPGLPKGYNCKCVCKSKPVKTGGPLRISSLEKKGVKFIVQ